MGLEWTLELTTLDLFSCIKMLRWPFAYSTMRSDNPHLNWCSWFTIRNLLVSRVGDLILRCFLDFLFLCFFDLFLPRCSSSLIATRAGWGGITRRSETDSPSLVAWASLRRHRFLSLMSSFIWAIFWQIYTIICIICHLISAQIFSSLKFRSSVLFSVNNERGRTDLGTRFQNG